MADWNAQQKQNGTQNWSVSQRNEIALMLEDMYRGIAGDLKSVKKDILNEMKYGSLQTGVLYQSIDKANKNTYADLKKEIAALCENLKAQAEEAKKKSEENTDTDDKTLMEIKYMYSQNQGVYESLADMLDTLTNNAAENAEGIKAKADDVLQKIDEALELLSGKIDALTENAEETDYDKIAETVKEKVVEALPYEETDYDKIAESVAEKTDAVAATHSKEILDVLAAMPAPENVDYNRIADEVGDKVLEKITDLFTEKSEENDEKAAAKMYDRIVYGTAEKVVESLPPLEKIDYNRIAESMAFGDEFIEKVADAVAAKIALPEMEAIDYDKLADAVVAKLPAPEAIDYEKLADAVVAKLPAPEAIDYEKLADTVIEKMPEAEALDYEKLAYQTASQVELPEAEALDYEKLAAGVAEKIELPVPEQLDYERLATSVAERIEIPAQEPATYEVMVDEEGIKTIAETVATTVSEKLSEDTEEIDTESLAGEIAEKMGTPNYEMILDEDGANMIAEAVAEKLQGQTMLIATAQEEAQEEPQEETAEDVVDFSTEPAGEEVAAEDEYVTRWDRSFTAKLKQSEDQVKARYSTIKNALLSYKKINSTVSWNCDRFNFGRATIAKMNIRGKTLCVYFALDPKDEKFKQTIYNQRDVSEQKAYEKTPFMMKVKSDLGAKRAVQLVETLAEQCAANKKKDFEEVDYVKEYRYAGDKQLEKTGLIKKTKGKKVVFNFD